MCVCPQMITYVDSRGNKILVSLKKLPSTLFSAFFTFIRLRHGWPEKAEDLYYLPFLPARRIIVFISVSEKMFMVVGLGACESLPRDCTIHMLLEF